MGFVIKFKDRLKLKRKLCPYFRYEVQINGSKGWIIITQLDLFGKEIKQNTGGKQDKTVISASRRTDVPAFFYDWLQGVLAEGSVEVPNPMFPDKKYTVDMRPSGVHSLVLWSKDFRNVLLNPGLLDRYNLYFQYTVNNYSKFLEPNVPAYRETLKTLEGLLKKYSPEQFNIRFDPIIISAKGEISPTPGTPEKARLAAFERLCCDLKLLGMESCRVTTSYLAMYGHVKNKIGKSGLDIIHLEADRQILFFTEMAGIAGKHGISLYSCASPILEGVKGINKGHCIDGELLEKLFEGKVKKTKDSGQRKACGGTYSRDIGIYSKSAGGMKCRHGCKYCYVAD